jgi:hypothetical protein
VSERDVGGSLPRRRRDGREVDDPEETTMQVRTSVKSGRIVINRCESLWSRS